MTWTVYAEPIQNTQSISVFAPFRTHKNFLLKAVRLHFVVRNNPNFTLLTCKIQTYADGRDIATSSNSWSKASFITDNSGVYSLYFEFGHGVWCNKDTFYRATPVLTGYTHGNTIHVALRRAYGEEQYLDDFYMIEDDVRNQNLIDSPYLIELYGTEF